MGGQTANEEQTSALAWEPELLSSGGPELNLSASVCLSSISAFMLMVFLERPGGSTGFAGLRGPCHTHARLPQAQHLSGRVSLLSGIALCPSHSARNWQSGSRGPIRAPCSTPGNSLPLPEPRSPCLEKGSGADGYPLSFLGEQRGNMKLWFVNSKAWEMRGGHPQQDCCLKGHLLLSELSHGEISVHTCTQPSKQAKSCTESLKMGLPLLPPPPNTHVCVDMRGGHTCPVLT